MKQNSLAGKQYLPHDAADHSRPLGYIVLLGALLVSQKEILGQNLSFADPLAVVLIGLLVYRRKLRLPLSTAVFFLVLSVVVLTMGAIVSPVRFNFLPRYRAIFAEFAKLVASFLYFILGFNITRRFQGLSVFRGFALGATIAALVAVAVTTMPIPESWQPLFFLEGRYIGFMTDPNYFAVLQAMSLAFFVHTRDLRPWLRGTCFVLIAWSILVSDSKTGFVLLGFYAVFVISREIVLRQSRRTLMMVLAGASVVLLLVLLGLTWSGIPVLDVLGRAGMVLIDPVAALGSTESRRLQVWRMGYQLVTLSPIMGFGLAGSRSVSEVVFGSYGYAHNTLLQLAADWGTIMVVVLVGGVTAKIHQCRTLHPAPQQHTVFSSVFFDMLIIYFMGSMSLSLGNTRIMWVLLGMLWAYGASRHPADENDWMSWRQ